MSYAKSGINIIIKDQPTPGQIHVDGYLGNEKRNKKRRKELRKAELVVYKRDIDKATRKRLASEGRALADGSYPIENAADLHNVAILAQSGHGDVAAAKKLIKRCAKELGVPNPLKKAEFETRSLLWKGEEEQQIFYGVVLEPDLVDSQGDRVDAAEIEKAAHRFLREFRQHDVQHKEEKADIFPVESYIAPVDFMVKDQKGREHLVRKGSWVIALKTEDAQVWDDVKNEKLTGLSMGGRAYRVPEGDDVQTGRRGPDRD